MTGAERIAAERATHAERGWTLDHDLKHGPGELVDAAVAFAFGDDSYLPDGWGDGCRPDEGGSVEAETRNLVIAGSLIAAELDCMIARGEIE